MHDRALRVRDEITKKRQNLLSLILGISGLSSLALERRPEYKVPSILQMPLIPSNLPTCICPTATHFSLSSSLDPRALFNTCLLSSAVSRVWLSMAMLIRNPNALIPVSVAKSILNAHA